MNKQDLIEHYRNNIIPKYHPKPMTPEQRANKLEHLHNLKDKMIQELKVINTEILEIERIMERE